MASDALLVVSPAVTSVATGGIHLTFYLVPGQIVAAMDKFPVRPVAVFDGWFDLQFIGVAVVAERPGMAGGAEPVIAPRVKTVLPHENSRVGKGFIGFQNPLDLVLMAFGAIHPTLAKRLRMGGREARLLGVEMTAGSRHKKAGNKGYAAEESGSDHFFTPLLAKVKS